MLCYSFLEKRGDYIKKLINWQLKSDNKEVINNENVECELKNNILKYFEDNNTSNIIDLNNKLYIRENDEFIFKIDFKNRLLNYVLKQDELSIENAQIEAEIIEDDNLIHLKYNLGEELKEIIIHLL